MRSRIPVDPVVQRIIKTIRKAQQLDEQNVYAARQQRAANRRKWIKVLPRDGLQALAALALQARVWTVRKTVVTVGQPYSSSSYQGPQSQPSPFGIVQRLGHDGYLLRG